MKHYRTLLLALLAVLALTVCALADGEGDGPDTDTVVEVADQTVEIVSDPDAPQDNDELFYEYMLRLAREQMTPARPTREPTRGVHEQEMGLRSGEADGSRPPANVETAGSKLTGNDAIIYARLKAFIQSVAAGERNTSIVSIPMSSLSFTVQGEQIINTAEGEKGVYTWTKAQLGVSEDTPFIDEGAITKAVSEALQNNVFNYHPSAVVDALMLDLPYDFYWYDKTAGYSCRMNGGIYTDETLMLVKGTQAGKVSEEYQLQFTFNVAQEYAVTENASYYPTLPNQTLLTATAATPARALAVVNNEAYNGMTDYERLCAYRTWICEQVSYNTAAVESNWPYGNPWQLIWVFDNDASTKVVCEGYSKAFKYLCDLSTFENNIQCYIVDGYMDGPNGGHMWNVVTMEDGKNYLVDVTNCDGWLDQNRLFLKGSNTGPTLDTITVDLPSGEGTEGINQGYEIIYKYWYSTKMLTTWGNGVLAGSILELSTTDYTPPTIDYTAGPTDSNYSYCAEGTTLHLKPTSGTAYLILARYSSGKLVEVKVQEVSTECSIENMTVSTEWKIFSVDGMGTCVPQGAALPLIISTE